MFIFACIYNACVYCVPVTMDVWLMPKQVLKPIFVCPVYPNVIKKCFQTENVTRDNINILKRSWKFSTHTTAVILSALSSKIIELF